MYGRLWQIHDHWLISSIACVCTMTTCMMSSSGRSTLYSTAPIQHGSSRRNLNDITYNIDHIRYYDYTTPTYLSWLTSRASSNTWLNWQSRDNFVSIDCLHMLVITWAMEITWCVTITTVVTIVDTANTIILCSNCVYTRAQINTE